MSEDEGAVLVDWNGSMSARSVPSGRRLLGRQLSSSEGDRNAISLYDSDSSDDEMRRRAQRSSSIMLSQSFHEDVLVDEDDIEVDLDGDLDEDLDDDDDDDDEEEEEEVFDEVDGMIVTDDDDDDDMDDHDDEDDDDGDEDDNDDENYEDDDQEQDLGLYDRSMNEEAWRLSNLVPAASLSSPSLRTSPATTEPITTAGGGPNAVFDRQKDSEDTNPSPSPSPAPRFGVSMRKRTTPHRERRTMQALLSEDKPWRRNRDRLSTPLGRSHGGSGGFGTNNTDSPGASRRLRPRRSLSNPLKRLQQKKSPRRVQDRQQEQQQQQPIEDQAEVHPPDEITASSSAELQRSQSVDDTDWSPDGHNVVTTVEGDVVQGQDAPPATTTTTTTTTTTSAPRRTTSPPSLPTEGTETDPALVAAPGVEVVVEHEAEENEMEAKLLSTRLAPINLNAKTDWSGLAPLPTSFLGDGSFHPSMAHYLDDDLKVAEIDSNRMAVEHSMLIYSILQLLSDREKGGPTGGQVGTMEFDEEFNASPVLKQGSLKKASRSGRARRTWKFKYVEIRQGYLTYYADHQSNHKQSQETLALAECKIRAINKKNGKASFVFEVVTMNKNRHLWMTSSEEERASWLKVLQQAKRGKAKKQTIQNLDHYQESIDRFQTLQTNLRWSVDKSDYVIQFVGDSIEFGLELPTAWLPPSAAMLQMVDGNNDGSSNSNDSSDEETGDDVYRNSNYGRDGGGKKQRNNVRPPVATPTTGDLWRFLETHSFVINGHLVAGHSARGPARIIGSLSRCLLEYDRSSSEEHALHNLTEAQALCWTREVLLSMCKSLVRNGAYTLLEELCRNPSLVAVQPGSHSSDSVPPIHINVTYTTFDNLVDHAEVEDDTADHNISAWVTTRSKSFKNWKNRFCVVSDGVLSYYEQAQPRPRGLRGQLVLVGATIHDVPEKHLYVLQIVTKDQERERQLSFRDEAVFLEWKEAIQKAIDSCSAQLAFGSEQQSLSNPSSPQSPNRRRKAAGRMLTNGGGRIISGVEGGFKAISRGASDLLVRGIRNKSQGSRRPTATSFETTQDLRPKNNPPSVLISVEYDRPYRICAVQTGGNRDYEGFLDNEETWM